MNEKQNRNRPIDTENKLMVSKGERVEGIDKKKKKWLCYSKKINGTSKSIYSHDTCLSSYFTNKIALYDFLVSKETYVEKKER